MYSHKFAIAFYINSDNRLTMYEGRVDEAEARRHLDASSIVNGHPYHLMEVNEAIDGLEEFLGNLIKLREEES